MGSNNELEIMARGVEEFNERISHEMQFDGCETLNFRLKNISETLLANNEKMQFIYEEFSKTHETMDYITEMMNQDPENTDKGVSYVKRR